MEDKLQEHLLDAVRGDCMSSCCSAKVYSWDGETGVCAECKEPCDVVQEGEIEKDKTLNR